MPSQKSGDGLGQLVLHLAAGERVRRPGKDDAAQHVSLREDRGRSTQGILITVGAQREDLLPRLVLIDLPALHQPLHLGRDGLFRQLPAGHPRHSDAAVPVGDDANVAGGLVQGLAHLGGKVGKAPHEGILFEDFFFDNIEILEEGIDDDAKSTLMEIGAVAIGMLRKANAILNTLPDMKYSVDNVKILFRLLYIYEARDVDVEVVIACIEEIKEIYEVNEWEVDSRYGLARTRLLIGYIQAGEMQKAEELYALIKSQSTGECPSFEEIVRQMAK